MIIFRGDLAEDAVDEPLRRALAGLEALGVDVDPERVNRWAKRRFAYEIDHLQEGYYVVIEFVTSGEDLSGFERSLRLADAVVRHKLIRLPAAEAARRGMLEAPDEPVPAATAAAEAV
ncbi:MAG: 30S ribosomal protein S6 [Acidimicrobiia bacterium]|nr:30S ribosomal protein S6 [Acidimicrobiia bacterium]MYB24919.1 30S ribosomal protein S6 [Acidimicrobiia bacterium]MYE67221.1 30S ribosomal protein S6 [Acidimicrobiia bacterium]MYJ13985.1 30S ribosomal protein S6 [Acidimicrobiia bacterium]